MKQQQVSAKGRTGRRLPVLGVRALWGPSLLLGSQWWWWHDAPCPTASTEPGLTALPPLQATMGYPAARPQVQCGTGAQEGSLRLERSQFPALPRWAHGRGNTGPSPPWRTPRVVSQDGDVAPRDTISSHPHRK